ncbi:PaaX family transcriptional regulator C-terminal domain-containing protein [Micromonospora sp. WMMD1102]|uniref:PaaX family transcriptional regulator n=1 Tax=Micromonospora sp. WMMD1102 TaxID=3016105 RepID=UPI0024150996|nr:PaaX family transcriptional regulator C-terminal domain-containing protein [Micromonospora sp. WMMD1102]MDG4785344.1 PaaX family transcriptional regulator C-terminal domain-containing protein [Micromonospora sp. WMMD1102]
MTTVSDRAGTRSETAPEQVSAVRPQTLLLTLLGSAVLGRDVAIFSGSCTEVMDRMGVSEHATRSTLTRMVNRHLLVRHRRGRRVYLGLTPRAAAVLREGEERMWRAGAVNQDTDGRWTLLGFSLPETRRDERHLLRSRLRWAGFGLLRSGMWIAPGTVDVDALLTDLRLSDHLVVFRAEPAEPAAMRQVVRDAYDLPAIAGRYHQFLRRWDTPAPLPTAPDDLARHLWLLSEWLLLLRDDPRIPLRHLPPDWPAVTAQEIFRRTHERLQPKARRIAEAEIDSIRMSPADPGGFPVPTDTTAKLHVPGNGNGEDIFG